MQERLRTPNERPVVLVNLDTTDVKIDKSQDAFFQMQTYSGDRGKGHAVFFSNITCPMGSVLAVTPGPNIACPPRGGDGVSIGVHLGSAEAQSRNEGNVTGFAKLLRGTQARGVAVVVDRGYIYEPNVNVGNNPTFQAYCQDNDILLIYRSKPGEMAFRFNQNTGLIEQYPNNRDETRAVNSGRFGTFLRAASENAHTLKNNYKYFGHRAHNSRLVAVGQATIDKYNDRYNKNLGLEWAETPKLNVEYLVCIGLINRFHSLFER